MPLKTNKNDLENINKLVNMYEAYSPDLWEAKCPCFLLFRCLLLLPGGM